ncbi:MAG TPA: hypothetical protein PKB13_14080 [Clostridia bacterium]|nr:hypothetical protein [Clostridia bacterium]
MKRINIPNTDLQALCSDTGSVWDVVDSNGNLIATLPREYTERDLEVWCAGHSAGHKKGFEAGMRTGFQTGRRMLRGDVLRALGVYDSMKDLQAQARILADIANTEDK